MVKAIVITEKEIDKPILVAKVQDLSVSEFVELEKAYLEVKQEEKEAQILRERQIDKKFAELQAKIDKLERQLAYDHGEIDSLEEEK